MSRANPHRSAPAARRSILRRGTLAAAVFALATSALAAPKVVVISLDGADPATVDAYLADGTLSRNRGLGKLKQSGVWARQNVTAMPSLTAVSHVAIATGSHAVHNDIPGNTFKLVVSPTPNTISGFGAPIGGYSIHPLGESDHPTAEPLWVPLRAAGKRVVTATWPGGDGVDVTAPGIANSPVIQPAQPTRTVDYTVPFGAFGGLGAQGFTLQRAAFSPADAGLVGQLTAARRFSFSPVQVTGIVETVYCAPTTAGTCGTTSSTVRTQRYDIRVAALDTTNDGAVNYDTLVFFDAGRGIGPGPFALPATGPAYAKVGGPSARFFYEGSGNQVGTAWFVSTLAPDLSSVRFTRYGANFIPRNAAVIASVDDINQNVGFWAPQADFRIPERLSPGFDTFPDVELEAIYADQVRTFVRYQTEVALRAIRRNRDADLVMVYIEQPDGSGHQFLLTDPRQATDPTRANTIGAGQDKAKIERYATYRRNAYRAADAAVRAIMAATGWDDEDDDRRDGDDRDRRGSGDDREDDSRRANIMVVSDHGMAPFHSAVNLTNLLRNAGIDLTKVRVVTSGPAANIYVNLQGRESGGTVTAAEYAQIVPQIAKVLAEARDANPQFNGSLRDGRLFGSVATRPLACPTATVGFCTSDEIGQDFGDVFAVLDLGYNFDGIQSPGVARLGEPAFVATTTVLSVPNFYGAHGYDPQHPSMSALFVAAGPDFRRGVTIGKMQNVDVAPTILDLLDTPRSPTMDGRSLGARALQQRRGGGRERNDD